MYANYYVKKKKKIGMQIIFYYYLLPIFVGTRWNERSSKVVVRTLSKCTTRSGGFDGYCLIGTCFIRSSSCSFIFIFLYVYVLQSRQLLKWYYANQKGAISFTTIIIIEFCQGEEHFYFKIFNSLISSRTLRIMKLSNTLTINLLSWFLLKNQRKFYIF